MNWQVNDTKRFVSRFFFYVPSYLLIVRPRNILYMVFSLNPCCVPRCNTWRLSVSGSVSHPQLFCYCYMMIKEWLIGYVKIGLLTHISGSCYNRKNSVQVDNVYSYSFAKLIYFSSSLWAMALFLHDLFQPLLCWYTSYFLSGMYYAN